MATIAPNRLLAIFPGPTQPGKSKLAHEVAVRAYKATNGPTEGLKRVYDAYKANKAKSTKNNGGENS